MVKFDFAVFRSLFVRVTYLLVFLSVFNLSCAKDGLLPPTESNIIENNLSQAKRFSESQTSNYNFFNFELGKTRSSMDNVELDFDWSNAIYLDEKYAHAAEVPIREGDEQNVYLEEYLFGRIILEGTFRSTTRLIVRYDKRTNGYEQFIITKIWYKGIPDDISNFSFDRLVVDAITIIYDVNGNVLTEFKKDESRYTFHPFKSDSIFANEKCYILFPTKEINQNRLLTRSGVNGVYYCPICEKYGDFMVCSFCQGPTEFKIYDVEIHGTIELVRNVCRKYSNAMNIAINNHRCGSLCYGTMVFNVARIYSELASQTHPIILAQDIYNISGRCYDVNLISYEDVKFITTNRWTTVLLRNMLNDEVLFHILIEKGTLACNEACSMTPSGGGGSGGGDTGGGPETPPNPDDCGDDRCVTCKGCIFPRRQTCVMCECADFRLEIPSGINDLMEDYEIILSVTSSKSVRSVDFLMKKPALSEWHVIQTVNNNDQVGAFATCNRKAISPGEWEIKARVNFGDGTTHDTHSLSVEERYPGVKVIKEKSKSHFESLWKDTKDFAKKDSLTNSVKEYGCWVMLDTSTGTYSFSKEGVLAESFDMVEGFTEASIEFSFSNDRKSYNPNVHGVYPVATFHTHYPLTWAACEWRRTVGPSSNDVRIANQYGVPSFVYDYEKDVYKKHRVDNAAKLYQCGPDRKITNYKID